MSASSQSLRFIFSLRMNSSFIITSRPGKGIQDIRGGKQNATDGRTDSRKDKQIEMPTAKNHNLYVLIIHISVYKMTKEDRTKASTFITSGIKILKRRCVCEMYTNAHGIYLIHSIVMIYYNLFISKRKSKSKSFISVLSYEVYLKSSSHKTCIKYIMYQSSNNNYPVCNKLW